MKAIAAMSLNRVIGRDGALPWHLPEDFCWFKRTTMGQALLMGRKTYESIGRPLPGRLSLVVSNGPPIAEPSVEMVRDLSAFCPERFAPREVWVTGGAEIFAQLLGRCEELYLSIVRREVQGDAYFPPFEDSFEHIETVLEKPEFEVRRYRNLSCASSSSPR